MFLVKILENMDLNNELDFIVKIQNYYNYADRLNIAYKYDDIYFNVKDYISKEEYSILMKLLNNYILFLKNYFNIARPASIDKRISPIYLESAQTPSFPSGHSTQYWFLYKYIKKYKNIDIRDIAINGSFSRIVAGVHYPMDEKGGIILAEYLFSTLFNED